MPSRALQRWRRERSATLDDLVAVHRGVSEGPRASEFKMGVIVDALTLRLATEFQGFARDLHDEAVDGVVASVDAPEGVDGLLIGGLTVFRRLNRANASKGSLVEDFGQLGVSLWGHGSSCTPWWKDLEALNGVRNALAHDNVAALGAQGYSQDLETWNRRRSAIDELAGPWTVRSPSS